VTDEPRFLAARSEFGYTDRVGAALRDEPEAVDAVEQRRQTEQVQLRDRLRLRRDWQETHRRVDLTLDRFAACAVGDPTVRRELGYVRRALRRLDRELGAGT
jgi:hypothetical protein